MKKLVYIFQVFYKWQEKVPMKNENKLIVSLFWQYNQVSNYRYTWDINAQIVFIMASMQYTYKGQVYNHHNYHRHITSLIYWKGITHNIKATIAIMTGIYWYSIPTTNTNVYLTIKIYK